MFKIFAFLQRLQMTKFRRHCERARRVWQSTNLNANLPLDCHEFARSRFAFAKLAMIKPLSYWLVVSYFTISCHTERSEVSINSKRKFTHLKRGFFTLNLKRILNSVDISLTLNMTIWIFLSFHSLKMTIPLSY